MITVYSITLIILMTLPLVGSLLMCGKRKERKREEERLKIHEEYVRNEQLEKERRKQDRIETELKRKQDLIAMDKWEQEQKIATGRDVNDEQFSRRPARVDTYSYKGPRHKYPGQCFDCYEQINAEHDRTCLGYRQWRKRKIEYRILDKKRSEEMEKEDTPNKEVATPQWEERSEERPYTFICFTKQCALEHPKQYHMVQD